MKEPGPRTAMGPAIVVIGIDECADCGPSAACPRILPPFPVGQYQLVHDGADLPATL